MTSPSEKASEPKKTVSFWEAYNFEPSKNMTADVTAASFYIEHLYMSAALEAFLKYNKVDLKRLNESMINGSPVELLDIPVAASQAVITKMIKLGYIEAIEVKGDLPQFSLTQVGLELLQNQTLKNLSATSFFNYQTHLLNKQMHALAKRSMIISLVGAAIAVLSVIISIASA